MNLPQRALPVAKLMDELGISFCEREAIFVVGHSLRSLYEDILKDDIPEDLKAIIEKLDRH
jgi:hypothetical protein